MTSVQSFKMDPTSINHLLMRMILYILLGMKPLDIFMSSISTYIWGPIYFLQEIYRASLSPHCSLFQYLLTTYGKVQKQTGCLNKTDWSTILFFAENKVLTWTKVIDIFSSCHWLCDSPDNALTSLFFKAAILALIPRQREESIGRKVVILAHFCPELLTPPPPAKHPLGYTELCG